MVLVLFYDLLYSNFGQTNYPQKINEEVKLIFSSKQSAAVKIRTFARHQLKLGMIIQTAANFELRYYMVITFSHVFNELFMRL